MNWMKVFSTELGLCYAEQNLELNDNEMEEAFLEDSTILEGELMALLSQIYIDDKFNSDKEIFVYGSLRKEEYNNYLLQDSEYLGKGIVKGFKMYSLGSYPFVYQTGNPEDIIIVEGYKVDSQTYQTINNMERLSGYTKTDVLIEFNGKEINGEIFKIENMIRYYNEIESGDWVEEKTRRYLYASRNL